MRWSATRAAQVLDNWVVACWVMEQTTIVTFPAFSLGFPAKREKVGPEQLKRHRLRVCVRFRLGVKGGGGGI